MDIRKLKENKKNPRAIRDAKFKKLVKSIITFPEMMELRPIVATENGEILGGNMRFRAISYVLASKTEPAETIAAEPDEERRKYLTEFWDTMKRSGHVPVKLASELTEEQRREFIIKDNASFGDWDWDALANEWETADLSDWGLDIWEPIEFDEQELFSDKDVKKTDKEMISIEVSGEAIGFLQDIIRELGEVVSKYKGARIT